MTEDTPKHRWIVVAALMAAAPALSLSAAAANECEDAVSAYNSAVDDISYRLRRYASCVDGSQGNDDCYSEFRRIKSAQDDFESAVSNYKSYCQ